MKLKEIIQLGILTVIGFALGMAVSMLTASLGMLSMYVSSGLAAFVVAPLFVIEVKRIKKRGAAFLFWLIYSLLYSLMGFWVMIPICLVSGILSEMIIGDYETDNRVGLAFTVGMFVVAMHPIIFVKVLGPEGIAKYVKVFSEADINSMMNIYTNEVMLITIVTNIILEFLAGKLGVKINNKFFSKRKDEGIL